MLSEIFNIIGNYQVINFMKIHIMVNLYLVIYLLHRSEKLIISI